MAGWQALGSGRWRSAIGIAATGFCVMTGVTAGVSADGAMADGATAAGVRAEGAQEADSLARWRVVDALPSRGELLRALAFEEGLGLAVGDDAGVSWSRDGEWSRAQLPPARDLAFDRTGRLWIGTEEGLYFWSRDARPQRRTLRDGEGSSSVSRIESSAGALVVATQGGAYWSSSGSVFQPLGSGSVDQAVVSVAVRRAAAPVGGAADAGPRLTEVWSFGSEGLVRTRGLEAAAGLRVVDRVLWPLPRPAAGAGAVDLVFDPKSDRLHVVYPDAIAYARADDLDPRTVRWQWIRPVMPPGAAIRRLVLGSAARVWLVTDRGLLVAGALEEPFARAGNPAGARECADLVESAGLPGASQAMALCRASLLALVDDSRGREAAPGGRAESARDADRSAEASLGVPTPPQPPAILLPADPPLAEIRIRALARAGLEAERAEGLWQGLRRRAFWPALELRGLYDADRDRGFSRDQAFVSGDLRNLRDSDRGEGESFGATVLLDWELGGIAYPEDSVDLSRELRQVTSLRDDVADEIHQLYFERQRIRARLARAAGELAPEEAAELVLRAAELDSGLDAWAGGWISAWRAANEDAAADSSHPRRIDRSID